MKKQILIAGPCAAESREQILFSIEEAKKRHIDFLRVNLYKPRTQPGFDGLGEKGLDLLALAATHDMNPGLEVVIPEHARLAIDTVFNANPQAKLLIWIGARNQNHYIQQEIARIAATDKRVYLMVKNQPWKSKEHWMGIINHCLHAGIAKENLLVCHRGFSPHGENPRKLRNIPDFDMAMEIRKETGLPMIFDPSHIGGTVPNVMAITRESANYPFDGLIVEVHPNPETALSDSKQQLTWTEFDQLRTSKERSK